jgi:putative ABC transport system permease protein
VTDQENTEPKINNDLIEKVKKIPHVQYVNPELQFPTRVSLFDIEGDVMLVGIKKQYLDYSDINIVAGKSFSGEKEHEVLVSKAVLKLFGKENDPDGVIGKEMNFNIIIGGKKGADINIKNLTAKIVGTTNDENITSIYIPIDALLDESIKNYSSVSIKVDNRNFVKEVSSEIDTMGLETTSMVDLVNQVNQAFLYFQIILGAIGGIALFVAAMGIVNTMTISLLERTHEIGVMKSLGARDRDVRRMFVYESSTIGFIGGLIGIIAGWFIGLGINKILAIILSYTGSQEKVILFVMPLKFAISILALSTFLSLLAGVYPARRAAKLSPLQALRSQN